MTPTDPTPTRGNGASETPPVVLYVGRTSSLCGACGQSAWPSDKAHTTPTGYPASRSEGCGAVWTHVVSTYAGADAEEATRRLRPDLIFGPPDPTPNAPYQTPAPDAGNGS